ncbi:MAG: hypothetical protein AAF352_02120 [Pseudomonadota bacterium]
MLPLITTATALASEFLPTIARHVAGDKAGAIATQVIDVAKNITGTSTPAAAQKALQADPALADKFRAELASIEAEREKNFQNFMLGYEGRAEAMPRPIQYLRGVVRPTLTFILAGAFVYGFINPDQVSDKAMSLVFNLNLLSMGFWFGERAAKNLGLNLANLGRKDTKNA